MDNNLGRNIIILAIVAGVAATAFYFLKPIYIVYNAKRDLEQLGVIYSEQQFVQHACDGDEGTVLLFIKSGMNLNVLASPGKRDGAAKSALHCAAIKNNLEMSKMLLDAGANVNSKDDDGNTPLYYLAKNQTKSNEKGSTDELAVIKLLLEKKANINLAGDAGTPLSAAYAYGQIEKGDFLLSKGADIKIAAKNGMTPLMAFVQGSSRHQKHIDRKEKIGAMIKAGADINAQDENGRSAIQIAINNRDKEMLETMVALGADLNIADSSGATILDRSLYDLETFKMLLDTGAQPGKNNRNPLITQAIYSGNIQVLQVILSSKLFDIDAKNPEGNTALHLAAARSGNTGALDQLLVNGANPNALDNRLQTPLFKAIMARNIAAVRSLLEWNVNVNIRDAVGRTPLYYAKQMADSMQRQISGGQNYDESSSAAEAAPMPAPVAAGSSLYNRSYSGMSPEMRRLMIKQQMQKIEQMQKGLQKSSITINDPIVELLMKRGAQL